MLPEAQPSADQRSAASQPQLVQPLSLLVKPRDPADVHQRPATPQRQRGPHLPRSIGKVGRLFALADQPFGDLHIGCLSTKLQRVARRACPNPVLAPQNPPQIGDMALQRVHRTRRSSLAPNKLDHPSSTDDLAPMQRQDREHRFATQPPHRPWHTGHRHIDRSEKSHLHLVAFAVPTRPSQLRWSSGVRCRSAEGFSRHCPRPAANWVIWAAWPKSCRGPRARWHSWSSRPRLGQAAHGPGEIATPLPRDLELLSAGARTGHRGRSIGAAVRPAGAWGVGVRLHPLHVHERR